MPRLSVWMVRASLLYFLAGFTMGALMLFNKGVFLHPAIWRLLAPHIEFLLLGWTMQLAIGVAFWITPRLSGGRGRGNVKLAWLAFALLNVGILCVSVAGWSDRLPLVGVSGRLAEFIAALAFMSNIWPRVRPVGT